MNSNKSIVMVASENDALIGGKVGGVGDVVRNLPRALASLGWNCTVIIPSYGFLHQRNPSKLLTSVIFPFQGRECEGSVWIAESREPCEGVTNYVVDHNVMRGNPIYYDDPPETPFMRDATKYAMFCSAVGRLLAALEPPNVIHLHDWHAATLLLLRDLHPSFSHLKGIRTSYTIHNLAIQGTRPMRRHESSVESWFPEIFVDTRWLNDWKDPRYKEECYTPMLTGIKHADAVNTVSPTYAGEILEPSDHPHGYYGGEGLEKILQQAKKERRLFGILNGCDYPENRTPELLPFPELCDLLHSEVQALKLKDSNPYNDFLVKKIQAMRSLTPTAVLTAVARVVDQKVRLLFEHTGDGDVVFDSIMQIVATYNGVCIILGSGATEYEQRLKTLSERHERLLFVKGFSERIANALYVNGTMFLMPSSFEPCGISQMIAMRESQPCIVHAVGGLKDTVQHHVNGFTFSGSTLTEQADGLVRAVGEALGIAVHRPEEWKRIATSAGNARFTWEESAKQYDALMYGV